MFFNKFLHRYFLNFLSFRLFPRVNLGEIALQGAIMSVTDMNYDVIYHMCETQVKGLGVSSRPGGGE